MKKHLQLCGEIMITECYETVISIPTYQEAKTEELPMFAQNRVHQRFTGNPYPNKVVIKTPEREKRDKSYKAIVLENDYLSIVILPEIGGKIYSAKDKTTGYDFFYKQHVIKPALIGMLGSWVSGGVEFNWPYHHRASTFMPVDYEIANEKDGITVWLSENEPVDRMQGAVGIFLGNDRAVFETRVRLYNRTSMRHSFLWWENAAVPVNPQYEIFFPEDVDHVHFHYRRSNTTFPIARGPFNGYKFPNEGVDISKHFNTKFPTSYFCSETKYDYFGGYDNGLNCGVVHIGDHHICTGKKMFTWAYNQLSKSWENALTDTDGAYAELMAGSYTNNQPDLTWIMPYETKTFTQSWYPIADLGVPSIANYDVAVRIEKGLLKIQSTKNYKNIDISLTQNGNTLYRNKVDLEAGKVKTIIVDYSDGEYEITIGNILHFEHRVYKQKTLPDLFPEIPMPDECKTAFDKYVTALHIWQYRDPNANAEEYCRKAIEQEENFAPALQLLGEILISRHDYEEATKYLDKAFNSLTKFNFHPESGYINYLRGYALECLGEYDKAYDLYRNSAWNYDSLSFALTRAGLIALRNNNLDEACYCATKALENGVNNSTAIAVLAVVLMKNGENEKAAELLCKELKNNHLNHLIRFLLLRIKKISTEEFFGAMGSDKGQNCLDIAEDLFTAGLNEEINYLFKLLQNNQERICPVISLYLDAPQNMDKMHKRFPSRLFEKNILEQTDNKYGKYLLGCLYYSTGFYNDAANLLKNCGGYEADRALAVYEYRNNNISSAISLLKKALLEKNGDEQLIFELAYVLNHSDYDANETIKIIEGNIKNLSSVRDDIITELAFAYNRAESFENALDTMLKHTFVPCEGGETAVAVQYIKARIGKGDIYFKNGKYEMALEEYGEAQTLPQNLGAGLWHQATISEAEYKQAITLEMLDKFSEAKDIYNHILDFDIDYFSNSNQPLLPILQAFSTYRLGNKSKAYSMIEQTIYNWNKESERNDSGYFGTTPFFISYMDYSKSARIKYYKNLIDKIKNDTILFEEYKKIDDEEVLLQVFKH